MFFKEIMNYFRKPFLDYFYVHLVDHCNLNCMYCDHFAPIADERYVEIKSLENDLKRMSSLVSIGSVCLMGGEPLLHPQLLDIISMSRKVLPKSNLFILTNGVLLSKQDDSFWKTCNENSVPILISRLPIELDLTSISKSAKKHRVSVSFYGGDRDVYKKMYKMALDLDGNQDAVEMSKLCWQNKGGCSYLGNGKFYKCSTAAHIHHLSKYFNLNISSTDEDCVDIYKIKNGKEIIDFYKKDIPFCKHCDIRHQVSGLDFQISKKELKEWL